MSAAKHSRSTFGCSEHNTFDNANGSIGITRVGKYTDGAALARAGVQRRAAPHVIAHVGDGDDQPESLGMRLGIHRVVEVFGVFTVDGDQRQVAQIDALRGFGRDRPALP